MVGPVTLALAGIGLSAIKASSESIGECPEGGSPVKHDSSCPGCGGKLQPDPERVNEAVGNKVKREIATAGLGTGIDFVEMGVDEITEGKD